MATNYQRHRNPSRLARDPCEQDRGGRGKAPQGVQQQESRHALHVWNPEQSGWIGQEC
jgi:hypothetical protein